MKTALILFTIVFFGSMMLLTPGLIETLTEAPKWQITVISPNGELSPIVNTYVLDDTTGVRADFAGSVVIIKQVVK